MPTCVPLANTQLEDKNIDSLCGSPIVFSSTLRSFYNKENNVDSKSAEESRKEADHGQAELRTSKVEWVEQYQLGVFITLTVLPSGKKGHNHCFDNVIKPHFCFMTPEPLAQRYVYHSIGEKWAASRKGCVQRPTEKKR